MRHSTLSILVFALPFIFFSSACVAQMSPCGVAAMGVMIYPTYAKSNTTFSAAVQTTHDQKLADGNSIHAVAVTHGYRDSVGRLRSESSIQCSMTLDGHFKPTISVTVNDPAKRTTLSWQINGRDKVAILRHIENLQQQPVTMPPLTEEQRTLNALITQHRRATSRSEKLSDRNIVGVTCEDTRTTNTTPAGEQGNLLPMETSTELCIARGSGLLMLRIDDSPLSGRTQIEVTELSLSEPDPSVFSPPPDYTIQEVPLKPVSPASTP